MILIVGAGPVGLAAALELTRLGLETRIIDQAVNPSRLSKAIGINPRTLELLELSGASGALIEAGSKIERFNLHDDGRRILSLDFRPLDHRYNFMLALPQSRTEAILADCLQSQGVQVERGCELVRLVLRDDRVTCWLKTRERQWEIRPKLVIGADGARSLVRQSINASFLGHDYDHDWTLLDARLHWPFGDDEVNVFTSRQGLLFAIAMGPGRYRLVTPGPDPSAMLPPGAALRSVLWRSSFRIAHRQAGSYREGPVFLAGDAAHVHSPIGARGMNMGIEDAAVLAGLIKNHETERYHALRHPVARRTIAMVDRQTRALASRHPVARILRRHLIPALLAIGPLRDKQRRRMLGLDTP